MKDIHHVRSHTAVNIPNEILNYNFDYNSNSDFIIQREHKSCF